MPLVSIITPAFNAAATIDRCQDAVRAQSFQDWEHIIVDDGSEPGSREAVRRQAERDARVRCILLDRNGGAGIARSAGIDAARGRYLAFIDADDLWGPEKLVTQLRFMQESGVALSYGAYEIAARTEDGELRPAGSFLPPDSLTYRDLLGGCPIGCLTVMYDGEALGRRSFPVIRRGQDWGLWLAIAREGWSFGRYPGLHATYVVSRASLSSNKLSKLGDVWRIYREQERLSRARSLAALGRHLGYLSLGKRRYRKAD